MSPRFVKCDASGNDLAWSKATLLDDFNRADGPLGSNWANAATVAIMSNTVGAITGPFAGARWVGSGPFTDSEASVDCPLVAGPQYVGARLQATGDGLDGYWAFMDGSSFGVAKRVGGTLTTLVSGSVSVWTTGPGRLGIRVHGDLIEVWGNDGHWVKVTQTRDSTYASGWHGIGPGLAGGRIDNFMAASITVNEAYLSIVPTAFAGASGMPVFVQVEVLWDPADEANWIINHKPGRPFSLGPVLTAGLSGVQSEMILFKEQPPAGTAGWTAWGAGGYSHTPAALGMLHRFELRGQTGQYGCVQYADQMLLPWNAATVTVLNDLRFGMQRSDGLSPMMGGLFPGQPQGTLYLGKIRIGSTWRGHDYLDFDPETAANLSAFTTHGSCTLTTVSAPLGDSTAPTVTGITARRKTVRITHSEKLNPNRVPAPGDFTVNVNGAPVVVEDVFVDWGFADALAAVNPSGTDAFLKLAAPVSAGQTVTVSYTPGRDPISDLVGNPAPAFSAHAVTNSTAAGGPNAVRLYQGRLGHVLGLNPFKFHEWLHNASPYDQVPYSFPGMGSYLLNDFRNMPGAMPRGRLFFTYQMYFPQAFLDVTLTTTSENSSHRSNQLFSTYTYADTWTGLELFSGYDAVTGYHPLDSLDDSNGYEVLDAPFPLGDNWLTIRSSEPELGTTTMFEVNGSEDTFHDPGYLYDDPIDRLTWGLEPDGSGDTAGPFEYYIGKILVGTWPGGDDVFVFDPATDDPATVFNEAAGLAVADNAPVAPGPLVPTVRPSDGSGGAVLIDSSFPDLDTAYSWVSWQFPMRKQVYVKAEIYISPEAWATWTNPNLIEMNSYDSRNPTTANALYTWHGEFWDYNSNDSVATTVPGVWHTVELYTPGDDPTNHPLFVLDGVAAPYTYPYSSGMSDLNSNGIKVGHIWGHGDQSLVRRFQIGSTYGASDILNYNPATETLQPLDLTGHVTKTADPLPTGIPDKTGFGKAKAVASGDAAFFVEQFESVVYGYDGQSHAIATISNPKPGATYRFFTPYALSTPSQGDGTAVLDIHNIHGVVTGDTFVLGVQRIDGPPPLTGVSNIGAAVVRYGTRGPGPPLRDAVWNYDGTDTVTLDFTA